MTDEYWVYFYRARAPRGSWQHSSLYPSRTEAYQASNAGKEEFDFEVLTPNCFESIEAVRAVVARLEAGANS